MDAEDFRRIALSFEGAEEGSHMGTADFRLGGKIFATLASENQGYGNLKPTPEQQAEFVDELPEVFLPIPGGWGRMGMTHIRLARASDDVLTGALRAAWMLRVERNSQTERKETRRLRGRRRNGLRRAGRFAACSGLNGSSNRVHAWFENRVSARLGAPLPLQVWAYQITPRE